MTKVMSAAVTAAAATVAIKMEQFTGAAKAAPVFCDHITERKAPSGYTKENRKKRSDAYGSDEYKCKTV